MKSVLSIAGSDSSGGAGIQADIKTIEAMGCFAQTAVTALTAQNTLGVAGVVPTDPGFVRLQIRAVFEDIVPDAVKIGMVGSADVARAVARELAEHEAVPAVLDPVMVATSGASLAERDAAQALLDALFPIAKVVTPNIPEACALSGLPIDDDASREAAARAIVRRMAPGGWVLVKGGHDKAAADDLLLSAEGEAIWTRAARIDTRNTHGTGCTLSSAIACGLACGLDVPAAVRQAKGYITGALSHDPCLGRGCGPLDHMWAYRG